MRAWVSKETIVDGKRKRQVRARHQGRGRRRSIRRRVHRSRWETANRESPDRRQAGKASGRPARGPSDGGSAVGNLRAIEQGHLDPVPRGVRNETDGRNGIRLAYCRADCARPLPANRQAGPDGIALNQDVRRLCGKAAGRTESTGPRRKLRSGQKSDHHQGTADGQEVGIRRRGAGHRVPQRNEADSELCSSRGILQAVRSL